MRIYQLIHFNFYEDYGDISVGKVLANVRTMAWKPSTNGKYSVWLQYAPIIQSETDKDRRVPGVWWPASLAKHPSLGPVRTPVSNTALKSNKKQTNKQNKADRNL